MVIRNIPTVELMEFYIRSEEMSTIVEKVNSKRKGENSLLVPLLLMFLIVVINKKYNIITKSMENVVWNWKRVK